MKHLKSGGSWSPFRRQSDSGFWIIKYKSTENNRAMLDIISKV